MASAQPRETDPRLCLPGPGQSRHHGHLLGEEEHWLSRHTALDGYGGPRY